MAKYERNKILRRQKNPKSGMENRLISDSKSTAFVKACSPGRVSKKHFRILRNYLKRKIRYVSKRNKRKVKIRYRFIPKCKYPITRKPSEIRMGKGKGAIAKRIFYMRKCRIFPSLNGFLHGRRNLGLMNSSLLYNNFHDGIFRKNKICEIFRKFPVKAKIHSRKKNV